MAVGDQAAVGGPNELLSFSPLEGGNGLEIVDHIERRHFSVFTSTPVTPNEISTGIFNFPVDRAVSIDTDEITINYPTVAFVRNSLGFVVAEVAEGDSRLFPNDAYSLELSAPVKLYLEFDSSFSVDLSPDRIVVNFDKVAHVHIGARSFHKQPAATITTSTKPEDIMAAVSYLGSSLKVLNSERSYPTLRGHPPTIKLGDELRVPSVLEKPNTGIRIVVPDDYGHVFSVATLAFYLGAKVISGDTSRIETTDGFDYNLEGTIRGFEEEVEKVLKQVFFLDCLTRTEGYYQVNLYERNQLEGVVELDFESLYHDPISVQLAQYLGVPYELIKANIPQWKLSAHVSPEPDTIETIPFLVDDLAIIKNTDEYDMTTSLKSSNRLDEFVRTRTPRSKPLMGTELDSTSTPQVVHVEKTDSQEQTWVGGGAPSGASKAMIAAFENRLNLRPKEGAIDITVICNDSSMSGEQDIVNDVYGSRDQLPFNVTVHRDLGVAELRSILQEDIDFLHYIGHIDTQGFECKDGRFDAVTLDETGVVAFFLNACTSYAQGMNLIRAGSVVGVVTLQDVINSGAERVGRSLARLLNQGFPLRPALNIAKTQSIMGGHYLVIGDGSLDIAQSDSLMPVSYDLRERRGEYMLKHFTYPNREAGLGTLAYPFFDGNEEYFLASGLTGTFRYSSADEVMKQLGRREVPVTYDGNLTWSTEISLP